MSTNAAGWDERHLAEDPAVELLRSLGYTYIAPEDLDGERDSFKEAVLTGRLARALKRLNPWLSAANVTTAVRAVTQVSAASLAEANQQLYTSLTYGIALEQDRRGGRKSHTVRLNTGSRSSKAKRRRKARSTSAKERSAMFIVPMMYRLAGM